MLSCSASRRNRPCNAARHHDALTCTKRTRVVAKASSSGQRFALTLKKPMGMVLAEQSGSGGGSSVFVKEVLPNSNAAQAGVQVGDILEECSAIVLKAGKEGEYENEGYGKRAYENWDKVMFKCKGESFDTVMKAISSNNERWGFFTVDLIIRRPEAS